MRKFCHGLLVGNHAFVEIYSKRYCISKRKIKNINLLITICINIVISRCDHLLVGYVIGMTHVIGRTHKCIQSMPNVAWNNVQYQSINVARCHCIKTVQWHVQVERAWLTHAFQRYPLQIESGLCINKCALDRCYRSGMWDFKHPAARPWTVSSSTLLLGTRTPWGGIINGGIHPDEKKGTVFLCGVLPPRNILKPA